VALLANDEEHPDTGNATAFLFTFFAFCAVFFSTVLITPTVGGQRHPIVWLFLCPFAEVKTLFDFGFLLYLHLPDAGCP
jgi:hypothetical protein